MGLDLGLKDTATPSHGVKLKRGNFYVDMESELGKAQRAHKKKRIKTIHAKIKNRRKDALHKYSTELVKNNSLIVVGNVSSKAMVKRKKGFAKSTLDAGWYELKRQIDYKSKAMQSVFIEVNEAYTTQTCSYCGCISDNSPKGRAGLRIREWSCPECETVHDRDVNAAKNILAAGLRRLKEGIPTV